MALFSYRLIKSVLYQIREPQVCYPAHLGIKNKDIGAENTYFLDLYQKVSR
jgi:hypothetical protein